MMHKIAERISFDVAKKQLSDGETIVHLSDNMSRCLNVLLENRDEVVTKEVLLKEVWERNGVIVTETSIRQTLSQLRRALINVGLEIDVIFTLPRQGYKFSDRSIELQTSKSQTSAQALDVSVLEIDKSLALSQIPKDTINSGSFFSFTKYVLVILLTFLIISTGIYVYFHNYMLVKLSYDQVSKIDSFTILALKDHGFSDEKVKDFSSTLKKYVDKKIIPLPSEGVIYLNKTTHKGNFSFFICNKESKNCDSVYIVTENPK